jgi:hypothetical protein
VPLLNYTLVFASQLRKRTENVSQGSRQLETTQSRNSPPFMEPDGSLPGSQEPSIGPYTESDPIHILQPYFPKIRFNINMLFIRFQIINNHYFRIAYFKKNPGEELTLQLVP